MYLSGSNSTAPFIIMLFFIALLIFEAVTVPLRNYRRNKEISRWTNTIPAEIVSIRVEKHYLRRSISWINEYPTLQYTVNGVCYCNEYLDGARRKGRFRPGDTVYIRYSDNAPENYIIECDCRARHWKTQVLLSAIIIPLCLTAAARLSLQAYLENHAFLFLEGTWTDMEESFEEFKDRDYIDTNGMKALEQAVSGALAYHGKLEYQISLTKSLRKKLEYQARLEESAYQAGSSLAEYYADYTGKFLYRCGRTELRAQLRDSMLCQFLKLARVPREATAPPPYTWEDLEFFGQIAAQLEKERQADISQPEEALGLAMAATELKIQFAIDAYGISPAMNQTLRGLMPGYWDSRLAVHDRLLLAANDSAVYPPLDRGAIQAVRTYMIEQYKTTGEFETSVLNTCEFAGNHLEDRRKRWNLQSVARCREDADPFTDFNPEDIAPQTTEELLNFTRAPKNAARDLLKNWNYFTTLLGTNPPSRFNLCLILSF